MLPKPTRIPKAAIMWEGGFKKNCKPRRNLAGFQGFSDLDQSSRLEHRHCTAEQSSALCRVGKFR